MIPAEGAAYLSASDRILGLTINGQDRAYPIKILNWHEVINDHLGGQPVLVSYCPLCGSGMAFDARGDGNGAASDSRSHAPGGVSGAASDSRSHARVRGERMLFGVSGKLYDRDYARDPYRGYESNPTLLFPVAHRDPRLPAKEWIIGVSVEDRSKAYPFSVLAKSKLPIHDRIGSTDIVVEYNPTARSARIADPSGRTIPAVTAYWFAWAAFHPETEVFGHSSP